MRKSLFFVFTFLFLNVFAFAQTTEDLIAKHIAAIGGEAAWKKVGSVKMEAKITSDAAAGMSIVWTMTAVRDKGARMDVAVMGMTQVAVVNGDKGWATNPFAGQTDPEPMTADQVKSMSDMSDVDGTYVGYKEKGYTVEYVGTEDVEGTETHKIKVKKSETKTEYSFLDPVTFYEIKNIQVETIDGKETKTESVFSDFKQQDGLTFPFSMQQTNPMMGNTTVTMTTITVNPTIDEKIFEMPAKK